MNSGTIFTFVPVLLGLFVAQPGFVGQSVTRLVGQDQIILRIPLQPHALMPQFQWEERKGPKCIATGKIVRAFLSSSEQVDFVIGDRRRVRAVLDEDCPALDFYSGLYLQSPDEKLCAGRDAIHSRMGGSCTIDSFRLLVPKLRHQP